MVGVAVGEVEEGVEADCGGVGMGVETTFATGAVFCAGTKFGVFDSSLLEVDALSDIGEDKADECEGDMTSSADDT